MPTIKARVGSQNVVRVLSNASSPPTKLFNLEDVNTALRNQDGMILVWDLPSQTFIMTSFIDSSSTTIEGIGYFTNTEDSTSPITGALVVSGGVGISKNLNVGEGLSISGIATFASDVDINAAVDILNNLTVGGNVTADGLYVSGISTLSGITSTTSDFYIGNDGYIGGNLRVGGTSEFIGNATFRGGTIGIGDANSDNIDVAGEFISNLVPNADNVWSIGIATQRWKDVYSLGK